MRKLHHKGGLSVGRHRAAGFSMIEVLIALLVLALGLLGFALLQTLNLRFTQSANYRTQATNLAYEMLDLMRSNRLAAAQYGAATFTAGSESVPATGCTRPEGTGVTVAQNVERWQCQVVETLGESAAAEVTFAANVATVTITWGERVGPDGESTVEATTRL